MSSVIFQWLERIGRALLSPPSFLCPYCYGCFVFLFCVAGLSYAVPTFKAMGITTPQALMQLTLDDYDSGGFTILLFLYIAVLTCILPHVIAVGVIEINDRRRLFELVHRVRKVSYTAFSECRKLAADFLHFRMLG